MKEKPILFSGPMVRAILAGSKTQTRRKTFVCEPGDLLWVRETWQAWRQCSYEYDEWEEIEGRIDWGWVAHPAFEYKADGTSFPNRWRSSMFMPKAAARLWLECTAFRTERLQDITEEDAKAEGAPKAPSHRVYPSKHAAMVHTHRSGFAKLWESIHGPGSWEVNPPVNVITFRRIRAMMNVKEFIATNGDGRKWERPARARSFAAKREGCEPCDFAAMLETAMAHRRAIEMLDEIRRNNP